MQFKRLQSSLFCLGWLFSVVVCCPVARAEPSQVWLDQGRLMTDKGPIPPGCLARLMTRLNGDNVVASIYLGRNSLRGCLDANVPFPQQEESEINYQIIAQPSANRYALNVCESIRGSLRQSCNKILIKVLNKDYQLRDGRVIPVLSLEKIGDVK
ncbi:MAG: hypothetical protein CL862_13065 [Cyanobium sp. NAT70]|nr:hypothetical protein [Cyanobium sp. NAT70]